MSTTKSVPSYSRCVRYERVLISRRDMSEDFPAPPTVVKNVLILREQVRLLAAGKHVTQQSESLPSA